MSGERKMKEIDRFNSYVTRDFGDKCWLWAGGLRGRYGLSWLYGKRESAHRASFMIFIGPIPEGIDICHSCDNPLCVNPAHLFMGTALENMRDMISKGRDVRKRGEELPHKLTQADVINIRQRCEAGEAQRSIAKDYGVSQVAVFKIKSRQTWKHVA